jgi:hypothetical protein
MKQLVMKSWHPRIDEQTLFYLVAAIVPAILFLEYVLIK